MAAEMEIIKVEIEKLLPYVNNSRTHSPGQVKELVRSMKTFGWTNPVLIDGNYGIIAGHGRVMAAKELNMAQIPCIMLAHLTEAEKRAYVIADNKLAEKGGWDMKKLTEEVQALTLDGFDATVTGFDAAEIDKLLKGLEEDFLPDNKAAFKKLPQGGVTQDEKPKSGRKGVGSLRDKFIIPPFSVLDARDGWWQERKRAWVSLGLEGELGRKDSLIFTNKEVGGDGLHGYRKENGKVRADYEEETHSGTSIFDPVLCELLYRWFCPTAGAGALDPFHGGEVRGVVASHLGIKYTGVDLRKEQTDANNSHGIKISKQDTLPLWINGDSVDIKELVPPHKYDFLITCPPYAGLEKYSDLENDLSNMSYNVFRGTYGIIINRSCELLNENRFAAIVVGDVRDKGTGLYCNFVSHTIEAFENAGLRLYNEAMLLTVAGSLPLRAGRQFSNSRKLGKTHQNVLIFVKGDPKFATKACGAVDTSDVLSNITE